MEDDDMQSAYYAARATLTARYRHLVLKFTPAYLSASGQHEASWIGGAVSAGTRQELLALVRASMGDCGGDDHLWVTGDINRDPADSDNVLITQSLKCPDCPAQERVITLHHPQPRPAETSQESADAAKSTDSGTTENGLAAGSSRTERNLTHDTPSHARYGHRLPARRKSPQCRRSRPAKLPPRGAADPPRPGIVPDQRDARTHMGTR